MNGGYILVITKGYGVQATWIEGGRWAPVKGQNAFAPTLCFA